MATLWEIIIKSQISRVFKICGCWGHADNVAKSCVEVEWCVEAMTIIRIPRATSSISPSTHIYRMFTVYHLLIMLFYSFFFLKKISAVFEIWFFFLTGIYGLHTCLQGTVSSSRRHCQDGPAGERWADNIATSFSFLFKSNVTRSMLRFVIYAKICGHILHSCNIGSHAVVNFPTR